METPYLIGGAAGLAAGAALTYLILSATAGGKLGLGLRVASKAAKEPIFAEGLELLFNPPRPKPDGAPVRLLAVLQREGRLLDFLMEDIASAADDQVGAAVREIHGKLQTALRESLELEPVMPQSEGSTVTVEPGFDPSAVRLTGHVAGDPPFRGTLLHPGWRVKEVRLPAPPRGQDEMVLMPAEVELPPPS